MNKECIITCPSCGSDPHPTFYISIGGKVREIMYSCGSIKYCSGYFKQSTKCKTLRRENESYSNRGR